VAQPLNTSSAASPLDGDTMIAAHSHKARKRMAADVMCYCLFETRAIFTLGLFAENCSFSKLKENELNKGNLSQKKKC